MYTGNEHLFITSKDSKNALDYTLLNFWQWAYSNLLHNMHRGKFAEFIVKCALEQGGVQTRKEVMTGLEPYDLEGPIIASTGLTSKLEIKSAAFVQSWDIKHPEKTSFSIAPAKTPDETGDYRDGSFKHRNNDIYIFAIYTATSNEQDILNLSLWEFYILPTYKIENDDALYKQKTISLKTVKQLCEPFKYENLCCAIIDTCNRIPFDYCVHLF